MKQRADLSAKPYYRCIVCPKFRTMCGGMPTRGMDLKEWSECVRDVMDYFGLSAAYVAKEADASQRTVERIHAVNIDQDIMRATGRRIELVVFGQATRLMCEMDYNTATTDRIDALLEKINHLEKENARYAKIIDKYLD